MAYKFTPKTEEEIQAEELCPEGKYPFTVLESSLTLSKSAKNSGKPLVKLKLNVHGPDADYHVYDYIADWFMAHKFRHFFHCTGHGAQYDAGEVDPSENAFQGREGWCDLVKQPGKGSYGPKNSISDYVPNNAVVEGAPAAKPAPENDDVPF